MKISSKFPPLNRDRKNSRRHGRIRCIISFVFDNIYVNYGVILWCLGDVSLQQL